MKRACINLNTNTEEQNASSIRPLKIDFVRMKKIITLLVIGIVINFNLNGQSVKINDVPEVVLNSLQSKYPAAIKASWGIENHTEYFASFRLNKVHYYARFDENGNWLETIAVLDPSEFPKAIYDSLCKIFIGYEIFEGERIESKDTGVIYNITISKNDKEFQIQIGDNGDLIDKMFLL